MYQRIIILIFLSNQLFASGWLDLQQRSSMDDISSDMRALASVTAVPRGDFLYQFGQVSYHQNVISIASGVAGQIQQLGFSVQPLPEWVFSMQLWSIPAESPVAGYGVGANYVWAFSGSTRWSTAVQINAMRGQRTFSQRNFSLTQHYTRLLASGYWGVSATYNTEKTVFTDLPGLSDQNRNYWVLGGNLSKNLFKSLQLDVCLMFGKTGPAARIGVNWGIGN